MIDEYHTQCIVQAFRLLNSDCPLTKRIISDSLCFVSSTRLRNTNPSIGESFDWINGKKSIVNSASKKTWWIRVINAVKYFQSTHKISLIFEFFKGETYLRMTSDFCGTYNFGSRNRKQLSLILHQLIQESYSSKWLDSKRSNFIADTIKLSPRINKMIFRSDLKSFAFKFIHRARTNTLAINASPWKTNEESQKCRRCHSFPETMTHVLQCCNPNKKLQTARHDACLNKIVDCLRSKNIIVVVNQMCSLLPDRKERIDLLVTDVERRMIFLVDMKCPIDTIQNFEESNKNNIIHYTEFRNELAKLKPDFNIELFTCIIGSLGTVPASTEAILAKIGVPKNKIQNLVKECAISNIEHSAKIWQFHSTGVLLDII